MVPFLPARNSLFTCDEGASPSRSGTKTAREGAPRRSHVPALIRCQQVFRCSTLRYDARTLLSVLHPRGRHFDVLVQRRPSHPESPRDFGFRHTTVHPRVCLSHLPIGKRTGTTLVCSAFFCPGNSFCLALPNNGALKPCHRTQ